LRHRQDVQHGVGRAAHGDVECHGVLERLQGRDAAREHVAIALLVVLLGHLDDAAASGFKQIPAARVGGQQGAVPRQRQPERLGQAVHAVGGEHARARSAGGTGRAFQPQGHSSSLTLSSLAAVMLSMRSSLRTVGLPF
jgi:hypothetical protein